ncbi:hypothetical protein EYC84_004851 [Monilinia fructicola]|uniref:Uncharacterized protein n=1 Tax=Monilinia fructicola TaxID=38448 RepID=A0A5M9KA20_MONFR|nr:hypothetical protein EYC84_004851 [Monilinia fructicola]
MVTFESVRVYGLICVRLDPSVRLPKSTPSCVVVSDILAMYSAIFFLHSFVQSFPQYTYFDIINREHRLREMASGLICCHLFT